MRGSERKIESCGGGEVQAEVMAAMSRARLSSSCSRRDECQAFFRAKSCSAPAPRETSPPPLRSCRKHSTPTRLPTIEPSPPAPTMADGIDRRADEKMEFSTSKEVTVAPTFEAMHLKENLLRGIYAYGYESPSAVQSRAIVQICKGRDTIAQAQSGTGKTATFSISILQVIDTAVRETQGA